MTGVERCYRENLPRLLVGKGGGPDAPSFHRGAGRDFHPSWGCTNPWFMIVSLWSPSPSSHAAASWEDVFFDENADESALRSFP